MLRISRAARSALTLEAQVLITYYFVLNYYVLYEPVLMRTASRLGKLVPGV